MSYSVVSDSFVTPWTVGSSVHGIFQARILGWVAISPPGDLPDPGVKPTSLCLLHFAGGFFTAEPPGKSLDLGTYR